jgi:hypothetical protein
LSISPWDDKAELKSPDGKFTVCIPDAFEIAMGAPTSGQLRISNGITRDDCNPSMIWSADSEYLAVPQWTKDCNQRLLVISVTRKKSWYASGKYRVLQLESFIDGVIKGIDSPIHMPRQIAVDVSNIDMRDTSTKAAKADKS